MKSSKKIFIFLLFIITIGVFADIFSRLPDKYLHVIFCDVGQGDSIFITKGTTQLLIDAGPDNKVISCLEKFMPPGDKVLEYVLITHPDADHITGFLSVFKKYQIRAIYLEERLTATKTFFQLQKQIIQLLKQGTLLFIPQTGDQLSFDTEVSGKILYPFRKIVESAYLNTTLTETQLSAVAHQQLKQLGETNDGSINLLLRYNNVSFLFTGDIGKAGELAMLNGHVLTKVNVLKSAHHGSKTSNSREFLSYLRPETIVISLGKNNHYHHPHKEALDHFREIGATFLRTDLLGSIEIISDGNQYWSPT
jgi:competence protein ComEC